MSMLSLEEALARLLDGVTPLGSEQVAVEAALGRYLAAPLLARRTQPAADLSAMDGYAMGAGGLAGPWRVVGESRCGHPFGGSLVDGEAVRISTGALMPSGAGAVLLQENAARDGDALSLNGEGEPTPRHIRREGFDFASGETVLEAGTRIGAAQLALAMSAGHGTLAVGKRPSVAVIDSGEELVSDPEAAGEHQLPASNGAMVEAMVRGHASEVSRLGPVKDSMEALLGALDRAGDADVVVTSGGASVGDHDLVKPALERLGAEVNFWRVAIRPGKPLMLARKGKTTVVGLPGNPVSAYVTAVLFVMPLLRALGGASDPRMQTMAMPLAAPMPEGGPRMEFHRAVLDEAGAAPIAERDSSALRALATAQALIIRPAGCPASRAGDIVQVCCLENGGIA
ncbi:molybdopterin molybdotransferase MoeA [Paraurantiacibacter namhicola]|uniref:Molybdopterin molybdenumtransferase n=1 Tax=Paraurantiacibacter namhicola TaxID=645517 RepID=A0A1C7D9T8_9SPHN|nr:molybdopterin molybdotransferase MoeA [Paraurantiacibacter namhicola]ANU08073.1 Molybdopterin molybdenumtransferase [Paraurantiacibacter namhicola]